LTNDKKYGTLKLLTEGSFLCLKQAHLVKRKKVIGFFSLTLLNNVLFLLGVVMFDSKEYYRKNRKRLILRAKVYAKINRKIVLLKQREKYKKRKESYPWLPSYYQARGRCTNTNIENYSRYGGRGIKFSMTRENFKMLWFRDKAYNMKKASIDRENNDKGYTVKNCRFIESVENSAKEKRKPITQYDKKGKKIRSFKSITEASKLRKIDKGDIGKVASNKLKTAGGFVWKFTK